MSKSRAGPSIGPRFAVRVHGSDSLGKPTVAVVSRHGRLDGAYCGVWGIMQQWAASHGAIQPGTTIAIVDTHDGGVIVKLEYLGFGDTLI